MDLGENYIVFQVNYRGKVVFSPEKSEISTSREMKEIIKEVAGKTAKFMESLLREKSWQTK